MIFTTNKKLIAQVVTFAKMMINNRSTLPILGNICFHTVNDRVVSVTATNLTQYIRMYIEANVKEFGEVALPATMLFELMATLPDEPVTVNASGRTYLTEVKCARHKSTLRGCDPFDMPNIPELGTLPTVDLSPGTLLDMLTGVVNCASDDDSRQSLASVKFAQENGVLSAAATDGWRLGLTSAQVTPYPVDALIPSDSIVALSKLLPQAGGVKLATNDRHAIFHLDCQGDILEILFASTLVAGTYPEYAGIIPKSHTVEAAIEVDPLARALKMARFFAADDSKSVNVTFQPATDEESGAVLIFASGQEGDYSARVVADVSDSLNVRLSSKFVLDALATCPTGKVTITGTTSLRPLSLRPCGARESEWYHLVMPMNK